MSRMSVLLIVAVIVFVCLQPVQAQKPLQVTVDANSVWIQAGRSPVLQYRYGDVTFKPYVKELFTPVGLNLLLDSPSDHVHHRGLMFAVGVDGVNFWEETPTSGRQSQRGDATSVMIAAHGGGPGAGFCVTPAWVNAAARQSELSEVRTIEVCRAEKLGATMVTWRSDLAVPKNKQSVTVAGSHYYGLGMRFVRSMDGGEFFNADGTEGTIFRGEEKLVQSDWCAYTAAVDGKPVTVAMFGHPANLRHPTTWFMMAKPFAYLSATLALHEKPLTISLGKPLSLRYAVVAWDGRVDKGRVNDAYRWFTNDYSPAIAGGSQMTMGKFQSPEGAEQNGK